MKRWIHAAVNPWKTKYEVHWVSPDGNDCLLGGSKTIDGAQDIARNQADRIFDSPFETNERKLHFLDNLYIWDVENDEEAMLVDTEEYIDNLMSEIHSRINVEKKKIKSSTEEEFVVDDDEDAADVLYRAEEDYGFMDIEDQVHNEAGIYVDYSAVRGGYGPVFIFQDPNHECMSDMWDGDPEAEIGRIEYNDYAEDIIQNVLIYPRDEWKTRYRKFIDNLAD